LVEIIKILGSPNKDEVLSMNESYDIKNYKIVPIRKKEWKKVF
jgi:glycogen synthase kinase 3 beta